MASNQQLDEIRNLITELKQAVENTSRPPEFVIFDDVDLRNYLKVSKRTTAYWREKGMITFSKLGGKIYYKLSDVLSLISENAIPAVNSNLKISI